MDFPEDFEFDDVVIAVASLAGFSGGVLVVIGVAFLIQSWIAPLRFAYRGVRATGGTLRSLSKVRPLQGVLAVVVTLAVVAGQLLCVGLCYLGGNYISLVFDQDRQAHVQDEVTLLSWSLLKRENFLPLLEFDWISGGYVAIATCILTFSYSWAAQGKESRIDNAGLALAWPAAILLPLGLAGAAVYLIVSLFTVGIVVIGAAFGDPASWQNVLSEMAMNGLPLVIGLSVCAAYLFACRSAISGSRAAIRAWQAA